MQATNGFGLDASDSVYILHHDNITSTLNEPFEGRIQKVETKIVETGGYYAPMHASILALLLMGFTIGDPRLRRGLSAIERFAWQGEEGKRIQACVSPVWDTVLMARGLCDAGVDKNDERLQRAVE